MPALIDLRDDRSEKVQYDNPNYPIYIRDGLLSHYPNFTAPSHWHDDIELIAVLSGEMQYNVNGEIVTIANGNGIFVNARQMHYGFSDTKSECSFICILLHPLILCPVSAYESEFIVPVIHNSAMPYLLLHESTSWHQTVLEQIHVIYAAKGSETMPMKVQTAFSVLWSAIYENMPQKDAFLTPQNSDLTITKNMVGFIQKYYSQKITLADIAASGTVGQSKCYKLFAKYFNLTPNVYLTQYRLNKSLDLLRDTDSSVMEIALSVGFGGASYYAETFRRWFGKSPTEFRNENA